MQKTFTAQEKAIVAIAAIKEEKTYAEISSAHEVHTTQIKRWKKILLDAAVGIFTDKQKKQDEAKDKKIAELHQIIGEKEADLAWLKKKWLIIQPTKKEKS